MRVSIPGRTRIPNSPARRRGARAGERGKRRKRECVTRGAPCGYKRAHVYFLAWRSRTEAPAIPARAYRTSSIRVNAPRARREISTPPRRRPAGRPLPPSRPVSFAQHARDRFGEPRTDCKSQKRTIDIQLWVDRFGLDKGSIRRGTVISAGSGVDDDEDTRGQAASGATCEKNGGRA